MARGIADYIRKQLNKGYDINSIKDYLLKSGYSFKEINEAINSVYGRKTHFPKIAIMVVVILIIVLSAILAFFYIKPVQEQQLKFELRGITTIAEPGGQVSFSKTFLNFDPKKTVTVEHEILDIRTKEIIASEREIGVVSKLRTKTTINIPYNAEPGNYVLKSTATQGSEKKADTLTIRISEGKEPEPGPGPEPKPECPDSCDDNNECTEDICSELTGYKCQHNKIVPCCGNFECEASEDYNDCPIDCKKPSGTDPFAGLSPWEKLEKIKEIAKTDERKASDYCNGLEQQAYIDQCLLNIGEITAKEGYCNRIQDDRTKDICLSKVAEKTNDKKICDKISAENRRDSCYMNFVINNNDYTVCGKISNEYLRQSCESLKELSTIQES